MSITWQFQLWTMSLRNAMTEQNAFLVFLSKVVKSMDKMETKHTYTNMAYIKTLQSWIITEHHRASSRLTPLLLIISFLWTYAIYVLVYTNHISSISKQRNCKCQIFQKGNDKNEVTAAVPSYSSSTCSVPPRTMSSSLGGSCNKRDGCVWEWNKLTRSTSCPSQMS